jgi:hypothetical protein
MKCTNGERHAVLFGLQAPQYAQRSNVADIVAKVDHCRQSMLFGRAAGTVAIAGND